MTQGQQDKILWLRKKLKSVEKERDEAYQKGYNQALDDNNILHGKDAEEFIDRMDNPEKYYSKEELQKKKELMDRIKRMEPIWGGD